MKYFLALLLTGFLLSCSSDKEQESVETNNALKDKKANVWISGTIRNVHSVNIKLIASLQQGIVTLGETTTDEKGNFKLEGAINGFGIYQLQFDNSQSKVLPLPLNVNDKLNISGEYTTIERLPELSGTDWAATVTEFFVHFNDFAKVQEPVVADNGLTNEQKMEKLFQLRKPLDEFARKAITKNPSSEANILFSTTLTPAMGYQYWDSTNLEPLRLMAAAYQETYADSPFGASAARQYAQIAKGFEEYKEYTKNGGGAKTSGEKAPEIALPNPNGKVMRLSELRGKYVLVDFWASWCGPCRKENPNVVKMYDKYRAKGFEIFSVSLDKDLESWKRAIASDNLKWQYHVSDLKQWDSSVIPLYGIESIPFTILLNPKGEVLAVNLRGAQLEQKLSEIFK